MRPHGIAWYEGRIAFGLSSLLPALLLPAYALLQWFFWQRGLARPALADLIKSFEVALPLATGLAAAHLMVVEREERFAELRATYPEPPWRLPLLRTGGALLLGSLTLLAAALAYRLAYGPYPVRDVLLPALPPALYLLGLSLLVGNLSGSYWAAAGTVLGYWFLEVYRQGDLTGILFLFDRTWPRLAVDYAANRWLLAGLGVALLLANAWLGARRRAGGRGGVGAGAPRSA